MFHTSQWADLPPGNCAKGAPGELDDIMFESRSPIPGHNNSSSGSADEALSNYLAAKNMCVGCPIKAQCLEQGMRQENLQHGVWGGLMAGERIALANPDSVNEKVGYARYVRARLDGADVQDAAEQVAPDVRTCRQGHPWHGNRIPQTKGGTQCKACKVESDWRRYQARKRERVA